VIACISVRRWHAFQHGLHSAIRLAAFPNKASALLNTPAIHANTTSVLFGINSRLNNVPWPDSSKSRQRSDDLLARPAAVLVLDEFSFISQAHMLAIAKAAHRYHERTEPRTVLPSMFFGRFAVVMSGDETQHPPVNSAPLWSGAATEDSTAPAIRASRPTRSDRRPLGRQAWVDMADHFAFDRGYRMAVRSASESISSVLAYTCE
jgi:hypothetical protein